MVDSRGENGPALGKYGNNAAIPGQRAFSLLRWLWSESGLAGVRKCHRVRWAADVEVWQSGSGEIFYKGFCRCHSVWACPLCAPLIRKRRAVDLSAFLVAWLAEGHGVAFVTATLPHDQGDRLEALFPGVSGSWRTVLSARRVVGLRRELPFESARAAEVTHGLNGWHPHLHSVLLFDRPLEREEAKALRAALFASWCSAVMSRGWRPPSEEYGLSFIRCAGGGVGSYVSKVEGLADEMTRLDVKQGRKGKHSTEGPFAILRRAVAGDDVAAARWREYEAGTLGRRALTYSRGFSVLATDWGSAKRLSLSDADLCEPEGSLGLSLLGVLLGSEADLIALHPQGFEVFGEAVGAATAESWRSALEQVRGSMPWWLSEAGWAREGERLRREREAERASLMGVQGVFAIEERVGE